MRNSTINTIATIENLLSETEEFVTDANKTALEIDTISAQKWAQFEENYLEPTLKILNRLNKTSLQVKLTAHGDLVIRNQGNTCVVTYRNGFGNSCDITEWGETIRDIIMNEPEFETTYWNGIQLAVKKEYDKARERNIKLHEQLENI